MGISIALIHSPHDQRQLVFCALVLLVAFLQAFDAVCTAWNVLVLTVLALHRIPPSVVVLVSTITTISVIHPLLQLLHPTTHFLHLLLSAIRHLHHCGVHHGQLVHHSVSSVIIV